MSVYVYKYVYINKLGKEIIVTGKSSIACNYACKVPFMHALDQQQYLSLARVRLQTFANLISSCITIRSYYQLQRELTSFEIPHAYLGNRSLYHSWLGRLCIHHVTLNEFAFHRTLTFYGIDQETQVSLWNQKLFQRDAMLRVKSVQFISAKDFHAFVHIRTKLFYAINGKCIFDTMNFHLLCVSQSKRKKKKSTRRKHSARRSICFASHDVTQISWFLQRNSFIHL